MKLGKWVYLIFAFLVGALIVYKSRVYFAPDFSIGFLVDKEAIFPYYKYFLYMHIIGAPLALLCGIYQFLFTKSKIHKYTGRIYVFSVLFLAAPGGLFMSFYAIGGIIAIIAFALLASLWFYFTLMAYKKARAGDFAIHKQWMTRSFILANSAVAIRLFSFINNYYELTDPTTGYLIISWVSWLPWLLIYEIRLRLSSSKIN